ncbi:MAG: hypothetical protein IIB07_08390 [Bacteroidetes bacterium]|nr:hypothetical protein [Bacteroidota bacterium]
MKVILCFITISILLLFSACSEHIVESTPSIDKNLNSIIILSKFSEIQSKIFNKSCALSGCHVTGVQSPNLSGNAYNVIVSKASTQGFNYIEPGNPSQSYLYLKLIGANNISGSRMPRNAPPLGQSVIDSISAWIMNGALNN